MKYQEKDYYDLRKDNNLIINLDHIIYKQNGNSKNEKFITQ